MDNTPRDHLEEAMALFMRYLNAYGSAERNLAQAAIDSDTRIQKFRTEFNDHSFHNEIRKLHNQFLHIGFMLAADPRPEESVLNADMFFGSSNAKEFSLSEKTFQNAVIALQEYAEKLADGEFKVTLN
jgi:hypothetical protein